jgi:hypothetical protein
MTYSAQQNWEKFISILPLLVVSTVIKRIGHHELCHILYHHCIKYRQYALTPTCFPATVLPELHSLLQKDSAFIPFGQTSRDACWVAKSKKVKWLGFAKEVTLF